MTGLTAPGPRGLISSARAMAHLKRDLLSFLCALEAEHSGEEMRPVAFKVMGQPMALAVHPVQVKRVLTENDFFTRTVKYMNAFRAVLGYNIITVPNDEWKPVRKRTAKYFSKDLLAKYAAIVAEVMERHAIPHFGRKARAGESVELFEEMLDIASIAVFMSFLGDEAGQTPPEVYRALNNVFCYVRRNVFTMWLPPLWVPTAQNRELNRELSRIRSYLLAHLESDRDRPTMLGDIIRTHTGADGRLDVRKVLDEAIANLVGGSETTIILMAWALYYIIQHPEVEARLRAEIGAVLDGRAPTLDDLKRMPYMEQVISETLRLRSPAYVSSRVATCDTELGGYAVAKDTMVFVSQHITHRHPRVWRDPDTFRPERFAADSDEAPTNRRSEMPFFPFGAGAFYCVGMNYAVNEAEVMVAMLLQRFRFEAAEPGSFAAVGLDARLTLRPDRPIRVRVRPA